MWVITWPGVCGVPCVAARTRSGWRWGNTARLPSTCVCYATDRVRLSLTGDGELSVARARFVSNRILNGGRRRRRPAATRHSVNAAAAATVQHVRPYGCQWVSHTDAAVVNPPSPTNTCAKVCDLVSLYLF